MLALAACGGHSDPRRAEVDRYFKAVDEVERGMAIQLSRVNQAYRAFSTGKSLGTQASKLAAAEQTIARLRLQLRGIEPPELARPIHRDLLRLMAADQQAAHEVTELALFLPRFNELNAPFAAAEKAVRTGLASSKTSKAQAKVLDAYAADSTALLARLRRLRPPALLAPSYHARFEHLRQGSALATALAAALRKRDRVHLAGLSARFQALEGGALELEGANGEVKAVRAYQRRLTRIATLQTQIVREREKLQAKLQ